MLYTDRNSMIDLLLSAYTDEIQSEFTDAEARFEAMTDAELTEAYETFWAAWEESAKYETYGIDF